MTEPVMQLTIEEEATLNAIYETLSTMPRLHASVIIVHFQTDNPSEGICTMTANIGRCNCHTDLIRGELMRINAMQELDVMIEKES